MNNDDRNEEYENYVQWRTDGNPDAFVITREEFEKTTELLDKVRKGILREPVNYKHPQDSVKEDVTVHVQRYRDHIRKEKTKSFKRKIIATPEVIEHALQVAKDRAYKNYLSYMNKKSSIEGIKMPVMTQEQFENHKNAIREKHGWLGRRIEWGNTELSLRKQLAEHKEKERKKFLTKTFVILSVVVAALFILCLF